MNTYLKPQTQNIDQTRVAPGHTRLSPFRNLTCQRRRSSTLLGHQIARMVLRFPLRRFRKRQAQTSLLTDHEQRNADTAATAEGFGKLFL
jgi:hypothetical protein